MKETRQLTCISCPMGCPLTVEMEDGVITNVLGYTCRRGEEYARKEVTNPRRTLTSVIPVLHGEIDMVSVKTRTDIPKAMVRECILALKNLEIEAPVVIGQVIVHDLCGTGVDLIATKAVRRNNP
ncbi:MAG TPA: DUF1667 domain-containing protein [Candidatus Izemoplasmatales bacterium]|nr:DUF1667 domain-containing protein [Bacillota bacterium]HRY77174.1 DUF1667 domain-containing protein [Candidatus Izemoplasmatales bacterium]